MDALSGFIFNNLQGGMSGIHVYSHYGPQMPLRLCGDNAMHERSTKQVLTVATVAELMGLSRPTVTGLFENEPGTIIIPRPEKMHKRSYRSIRIPCAVFERVLRRYTVR